MQEELASPLHTPDSDCSDVLALDSSENALV